MIRLDNSLSRIYGDGRYLKIIDAVSTYVPYAGATTDVNLGTKNFLTTGTLGAGVSTLGSTSITAATDVVPLTLKGGGAGTADLQRWYDKDNTLVSYIRKYGDQYWRINGQGEIQYIIPGGYPGINFQAPIGTTLAAVGCKSGQAYFGRSGEYGFKHYTTGYMELGNSSDTTLAYSQLFVSNSTGTTKRPLVIRNQASQTGNSFEGLDSSNNIQCLINKDGGFTFNEQGIDTDSRVEGDTNPNLFYVDAGTDRIGIGRSAPWSLLDIGVNVADSAIAALNANPNSQVLIGRDLDGAAVLSIGTYGGDYAYVQYRNRGTGGQSYPLTLNPLGGNVGIGDSAPGEKLDVAGNVNLTGVLKVDDVQVVNNQQAHIANPAGGLNIDTEARTAINSILTALETHGLLAIV